jgi:hypothetical protein
VGRLTFVTEQLAAFESSYTEKSCSWVSEKIDHFGQF